MSKPEKPRTTHKWLRTDRPLRAEPLPPAIRAQVPSGALDDPADVAEATRAALAGWPILVLRIVARIKGRAMLGRHPARWVRRELLRTLDHRLCSCEGLRCTKDHCTANRLLGRHGKAGASPDGEAWAPFAIRAADLPSQIDQRGSVTFELVLAGKQSTEQLAPLLDALAHPPEPAPRGAHVEWPAVHALQAGDDGELRWKKALPSGALPVLALDQLTRPRVRERRLMVNFVTAAPVARQGETGRPVAEFSLILDRMSRTLGAWMGRTGHKGPRLPVDGLLKLAAEASIAADNSRVVEVPGNLLGASGSRDGAPERSPALTGAITWNGQFGGVAPLLRAVHYIGVGPGRQHGLGQIIVR